MLQLFDQGPPGFIRKLNALVEAVEKLMRMKGDGAFIKIDNGTGDPVVSLNIDAVLPRIPKPVIPAATIGQVSNITGLSNNTTFSYRVTLGSIDMTSNTSTGGTLSLGNITVTAFPDKLHATPITAGERVILEFRGNDSNGTQYYTIVGAPSSAVGTITGHSNGTTSFSPYTLGAAGLTINAYNGTEDTLGSPGKLGVTVNSNGTVGNGTCVVKPLGNATVLFGWDYANSRWAFNAPNSAG